MMQTVFITMLGVALIALVTYLISQVAGGKFGQIIYAIGIIAAVVWALTRHGLMPF